MQHNADQSLHMHLVRAILGAAHTFTPQHSPLPSPISSQSNWFDMNLISSKIDQSSHFTFPLMFPHARLRAQCNQMSVMSLMTEITWPGHWPLIGHESHDWDHDHLSWIWEWKLLTVNIDGSFIRAIFHCNSLNKTSNCFTFLHFTFYTF